MNVMVRDWLDSRQELLRVFEGDDEITLRRHDDGVLLGAQLTPARVDNLALKNWLRPGAASLNHFQGALAQNPDTGALWLVQHVKSEQPEAHVLTCLEALLNQRDTWRATVARLAPPALDAKPTSLRSLSY